MGRIASLTRLRPASKWEKSPKNWTNGDYKLSTNSYMGILNTIVIINDCVIDQ